MWRRAWCSTSRLPNASRCCAQAIASATAVRDIASVAAMPLNRSTLNCRASPAKPLFSGADQPVERHAHVAELERADARVVPAQARDRRAARCPGLSASISSNEIPPAPALPVRTAARMQSARMAPEISVFEPLTSQWSSRRSARVCNAPASEPPRRLRDGERNAPLSGEHRTRDRLQQFFGAELHDRRQPDPVRRQVGKHDAGARPMHFLGKDHAVVRVGVLGVAAESLGKADAEQTLPAQPTRTASPESAGCLPGIEVGFDFASDEVPHAAHASARAPCVMNGEGGRRPSKSSTAGADAELCIDEPRTLRGRVSTV